MHFHVVTPSFNQFSFLKRCVAAVSDQVGSLRESVDRCLLMVDEEKNKNLKNEQRPITIHHHIQDGGSTDGTREFLAEHLARSQKLSASGYTFSFSSEKDDGMYDAINKGWLRGIKQERTEDGGQRSEDLSPRAQSPAPSIQHPAPSIQHPSPSAQCPDNTILAHLNCDEQYLPGALEKIAEFFSIYRNCDVVLADMIVVNNNGNYICHRRSLKPSRLLSRICCVGMTTTTFQRASVVRDRKVLFDTSWRNIGDMVWYNALHAAGVRFGVCNELVSIFVDTGHNLNLTEEAVRERKRYADEYLWGMRRITRLMSKFYSLRRYLKEFYLKPPTEYALYLDDLTKRDVRPIETPTGLWHRSAPNVD
jgi:hypothetical protein